MNIEVEHDNYISFTSIFQREGGTRYESWVYRERVIKTGKYEVGGHITISNPKKRLYDVRDHTEIKEIVSEKLAEIHCNRVKQ
jgi:hypothetical protein